jgi:indolepyruvate ferredoxin oxidoreductase alpha subunit
VSEPQRVNGEQALARGAIRAGVRVVAGYPGSPSTGVLTGLLSVADEHGIYVEWSVNEKVAFEVCWGAAISGLRSLLCVKGVGLNVALDTVMAVNLAGTRAGCVLVVGDDPSAYRSQNEQDSRLLGQFTELPMIEATRVAHGCGMMEYAFELSERIEMPVIVREVRSFAFTTADVLLPSAEGPPATDAADVALERTQRRWIASTSNVIPRHRQLHEKLDGVEGEFSRSPFNCVAGEGTVGILSAGFCGSKVDAALDAMELPANIARLDLATLLPMPSDIVVPFLDPLDRVLIVEEIEPYVEMRVKAMAHDAGVKVEVCGKQSGHLPREGELLAAQIAEAIATFLGTTPPADLPSTPFSAPPLKPSLVPPVSDGLCEGCPYDPTFRALGAALEDVGARGVIVADPGCAVRLMVPPLEMLDVKMAMGSCVGIAAGIARSNPEARVIACPGDSGFFHSALLGLANAAYNRVRMIVLVLDNLTTALSGCQPSPTTGRTAAGVDGAPLLPEKFADALNIDLVRVFDPSDPLATRGAFADALAHDDLSLLVMRSPCILL